MRRTLKLLLLGGIASAALGCATIFAPGPDLVPVYSTPSGAIVLLDNMEAGQTPCIVAVPRSSEGVFTFQLAGYEPVTVERHKVCNGLTALNLIPGLYGAPLFLIDAIAGNIGKYSTKPIQVQLKPVKPKPAPTPPTLGNEPS